MTAPDEQIERPTVAGSRRVYDRWFGVRVDSLRYRSGRESDHDVVEHRGGITIVAVDAEGRLLLVRQYRHAVGRELLELPAGTLDGEESAEAAAQRELQEEAGYRARTLERLGGFYTAPGYCTEYLHVFLATDLVESRLEGDEEAIDVELVTPDEALERIASGEIEDAKTSGALLLYLRRTGRV